MSVVRPVRNDGLTHTTLRIGPGLAAAQLAQVVHALQRVPGVLTADADAASAQAFVGHDAAVPISSLVAAAKAAGTVATTVAGANAEEARRPRDARALAPGLQRRRELISVGMAALLAVVFIEIALPDSSDKRWFFIMPAVALWALILLRAMIGRHP